MSDAQYARLAPLLLPPSNHLKTPHRQVLDAWLYVLYQGCICRGLQREALGGGVDPDTLSLDSTIVKFHAHRTGAPTNRGTRRSDARADCPRLWGGGLTYKLHGLATGERIPVALSLSTDQAADGPVSRALLRALGPVSGRPALLMDRAHEGDRTRRLAVEPGHEAVLPPKSNRRRPWTDDAQRYRRRNKIERLFGRLKRFRRIGYPYGKLDVIFLSGIYLALIYDVPPSM